MERLTVAALIPFKHYIYLRRTGKTRVVKYDNKKIILRSSILPKPNEPLEVRYSRVRLRKLLKKKNKGIRERREETLRGLPRERPYALYRLLLRLERIRSKGISRTIKELKREVSSFIIHPSAVLRKALRRLVAMRIKRAREDGEEFSKVIIRIYRASGIVGKIKAKMLSMMGYKRIGETYVKISLKRS